MPDPIYLNPHLNIYIRAQAEGEPDQTPPRLPSTQELRLVFDMGPYTMAKLQELLGVLESRVENWVSNNPSH